MKKLYNNLPVLLILVTLLVIGGCKKNEIGSITSSAAMITSFSPTGGSVGTLVTITGKNLDNPTAFSIGGVPAIVVSNTGSQLVGMVIPGAVTGVVSVTSAGGSAGTKNSFTVSTTSHTFTQQGSIAALVGSVDISADGNTAIVGLEVDNNNIGAACIYTRNGGVWSQQGSKLVGTGSVGRSCQGYSVSLSADGNTAIVGSPYDDEQRMPKPKYWKQR